MDKKLTERKLNRLKGYDYAQPGYYFVTVCTKDRALRFGDVQNGRMVLNDAGKIVHNEWVRSQEIRQEIQLDEFVIMPNHIHGIVAIG